MTIEVTAKKVQDAIDQGLAQLGVSLDDVNVEVVDAGGFLRKAKVRLTVEEPEKKEEPAVATNERPRADAEVKAKPESGVKADNAAKSETVGKSEKAAKPAAKKSEKASSPKKPENGEQAAKQKPEKASKPEQSDSATKPSKTAKPEKAAKEADEQNADQSADGATDKKPRRDKKRRWGKEEREAAERAKEFVKKTVELMGFEGVTVEFDAENPEIIAITAPDGDDSLIIGRHGETLSSLTYLAETCAIAEKCRVGIVVDCNGYRARRAASLTAMAKRRARECASKQRRIKLESMDRTDRRTVHMALADDAYVTTESEGKEPYRSVVIVPKEGVRPEPSARKDRGGRDRKFGKDRGERSGATQAPQKRASFNVNLHGFVGHNDDTAKDESEPAQEPETV